MHIIMNLSRLVALRVEDAFLVFIQSHCHNFD